MDLPPVLRTSIVSPITISCETAVKHVSKSSQKIMLHFRDALTPERWS